MTNVYSKPVVKFACLYFTQSCFVAACACMVSNCIVQLENKMVQLCIRLYAAVMIPLLTSHACTEQNVSTYKQALRVVF